MVFGFKFRWSSGLHSGSLHTYIEKVFRLIAGGLQAALQGVFKLTVKWSLGLYCTQVVRWFSGLMILSLIFRWYSGLYSGGSGLYSGCQVVFRFIFG